MDTGITLEPPFFEIGPKAYVYGAKALQLAMHADQMSEKYNVRIIFTPQYVDIPLIANNTKRILVFAQHMDPLEVGRGIGSVLPEALKEAGADGFLLNHAEKRVSLDEIAKTINRGNKLGLLSMICADSPTQAIEIAKLNPDMILAEPPDLIGVGIREDADQEEISRINHEVWQINPGIRVLHGAGIKSGKDIYNIIKRGAQGSGSTSGILLADDPFQMLEEMISATREAWNEVYSSNRKR